MRKSIAVLILVVGTVPMSAAAPPAVPPHIVLLERLAADSATSEEIQKLLDQTETGNCVRCRIAIQQVLGEVLYSGTGKDREAVEAAVRQVQSERGVTLTIRASAAAARGMERRLPGGPSDVIPNHRAAPDKWRLEVENAIRSRVPTAGSDVEWLFEIATAPSCDGMGKPMRALCEAVGLQELQYRAMEVAFAGVDQCAGSTEYLKPYFSASRELVARVIAKYEGDLGGVGRHVRLLQSWMGESGPGAGWYTPKRENRWSTPWGVVQLTDRRTPPSRWKAWADIERSLASYWHY